jgi:hypothetical protein
LSDVTGTRDGNGLALPVLASLSEHFVAVVDETVTGSLGTNLGSTKVVALASKNTGPLVTVLL